jgi:hypothetical protein
VWITGSFRTGLNNSLLVQLRSLQTLSSELVELRTAAIYGQMVTFLGYIVIVSPG